MEDFLEEEVFDLGPKQWVYYVPLGLFRKTSGVTGSKAGCRERSWLETRPANLSGSDPVGPVPKQPASTWGESLWQIHHPGASWPFRASHVAGWLFY